MDSLSLSTRRKSSPARVWGVRLGYLRERSFAVRRYLVSGLTAGAVKG